MAHSNPEIPLLELEPGGDQETRNETDSATETGTDEGDEDSGSQELDSEAQKEAARPAVMRRLQQLDTRSLKSAYDMLLYTCGSWADQFEDGVIESSFDEDELLAMSRPIIESRMAGEREYLHRLYNEFRSQSSNNHGVWDRRLALPNSDNERYKRWLEAGDPFAYSHFGAVGGRWYLTQDPPSEDGSMAGPCLCPYAIDVSQLAYSWALVLSDLSLQLMCEIGNHFHVSPALFINHRSSDMLEDVDRSARAVGPGICHTPDGFCAAGMRATIPGSVSNLVFNMWTEKVLKEQKRAIAGAQKVKLSASLIGDSSVAIVMDDPTKTGDSTETPPVAPWDAAILPTTTFEDAPVLLNDFLAVAGNVRKLCELWQCYRETHMPSRTRFKAFMWLWAVWLYERDIRRIAFSLQVMDYESVTLSTSEALDRVKAGRARVAQLRKNLAQTKAVAEEGGFVDWAYGIVAKRRNRRMFWSEGEATDNVEPGTKGASLAPRQMAALSIQEEYAWLDKQAADLMPQLNDNLQVVIATINVEDAQVSRRNGERATLLALIAAIYLPLTLATGIFGMNISGIGGTADGPTWRAVAAVAGALLGVSVIFIVIFWLWPKRNSCSDTESGVFSEEQRARTNGGKGCFSWGRGKSKKSKRI